MKPPTQSAFRRHRAASLGGIFLLFLAFVVLVLPQFLSVGPNRQDLALGPTPPSAEHWFGTDYEGRDLFSRSLAGGRISLLVGVVATFISLIIGVGYGAISGFVGGRVDRLMMRFIDVLYGLPYMFFVIILMVWSGRSLINLFIGLGAISWLTMARIVRAEVRSLKDRDFVLAAALSGQRPWTILWRHILPNAAGPIIVYATLTVPRVMIEESFLSFLGLGVQPPNASWGSLLSEGASLFREYPWLLFYPALCLSLTLLALNFVGDGLRDQFDPRKESR